MTTFSTQWKGVPTLALLIVGFLIALSEAGKSKNYIRNSNYSPQDQPQRPSFYPPGTGDSRFRRNFRSSQESSQSSGFPGFATSPRRSSFNARKGGPRGFGSSGGPSAAFSALGGPEAFLEAATTERTEYDETLDVQAAFKFPGSGGFGSSRPRPTRGRKGGASKGGTKGGGGGGRGFESSAPFSFGGGPESSPTSGFGQDVPPSRFQFPGSSSAGFPGSPGAKFSSYSGSGYSGSAGQDIGGSSSLEFGGPSSSSSSSGFRGVKAPSFGEGSNAFFSGSSGSSQPIRTPFGSAGFPALPNPSFSASLPSRGAPGSNPFGSAEPFAAPMQFAPPGGSGGQFPPPGKTFDINSLFSQPIDSDAPVVFPPNTKFIGQGPPNLPFDITEQLAKILGEVATTSIKPPLRVTSAEDADKVFSSSREEEYDSEDFYALFGDNTKKSPELRRGCISRPASPANGRTDCSTYSGCKAICNRRFQFPGGEKRLFLDCNDETGEWEVAGDSWETLPDCVPVCREECQNSGICLAPDTCECPDNWEGPTCEIPKTPSKKECGSKPPTPMNSRILCSRDECMARCYEDYHFEEGLTRLTFECLDGEWTIPTSKWDDTPDCTPICDPECINGGRCIAPNVCECTPDFRGPSCQYPISNCDPKKLGFNGGYNCSGEGMDFGCALWCPEGVDFEFPASDFYKCDYATSLWTPSPIPNCDYSKSPVRVVM